MLQYSCTEILTPIERKIDVIIKDIRNGQFHSIILDINNLMYSIGCNSVGQLGLGHKNSQSIINKININNIKCINCSSFTSYATLINGECLSFGSNETGASGHPKNMINILLPKKIQYFIDNNIKINEIKTGCDHAIFISNNNNLPYLCGRNSIGAIGLNMKRFKQIFIPRKFDKFQNNNEYIIQSFIGEWTTIFISNSLNIYFYGRNNLFPDDPIIQKHFNIDKIYGLTNNFQPIIEIIPCYDETFILQYQR